MPVKYCLTGLLLFLPLLASAQDSFDFDTPATEETVTGFFPVLDILLRHDAVRDLPRPVDADFDRQELRMHTGLDWFVSDELTLRATGRLHATSQENRSFAFNLDNERLEEVVLDEVYADQRWQHFGFRIGQSSLPATLSPVVWDQDLRVRGLMLAGGVEPGTTGSRWLGAAGEIDHPAGSMANIELLQWQGRWQPAGFLDTRISIARFHDVNALAQARRTNSRDALTNLAEEFELVMFDVDYAFADALQGWRLGVQLGSNLAADANADSGRVELVYGGGVDGGVEFGLASQRIQQDAVPAAFNDDDWWFPTNMRGHRAWIGYHWLSGWGMRVSAFQERVDPAAEPMQRVLFDVTYRP
jgi:hypothetical protein